MKPEHCPTSMPKRLATRVAALALLVMPLYAAAMDVTVSAAASLRDAFTEIAREFERANPQHKVLLDESEMPTRWYNIMADLPTPPPPPPRGSAGGRRWSGRRRRVPPA